ncbi:MAG: PAS domain S-box protein [Blastocatellales bacterium]
MRIFSLTRTQRYGIAILGVALATILRLALDPLLGEELPLFIFIFPVVIAAWYGGLWPGLLATALSTLLGELLFIMPRGKIFLYDAPLALSLAVTFGFIGTAFSMLIDSVRNSIKIELEYAERFRLLVEGVRDYAIFMLDPQGSVVSWNSGAERINGYAKDEIIGRSFLVLRAPEDIEGGKPQRVLEIAATKGSYEEEGWYVRKDGSRYWASGVITALRDYRGRLRGFAKVTRDITERKLAEETLRESQQFVQHIVEVSPSMIYLYDVEQRKNVFINRGIAAALGYDPGWEAHEIEFAKSVLHPDDWRPFLAHLSRFAGLRDDETAEFEYRMRHISGDWRWYHSRNKVFARNDDGSAREIIGTATDITERRRAEEKAKFLADLNQTLRPLTDPEELMAAAARMLCEHLDVDRCVYAEVKACEDHIVVTSDYTRGATPSLVGRFSLGDFGPAVLRVLLENRPYVINDLEAEAPPGMNLSASRQAEIRAMVCAPLNKGGDFVARMSVQQKTPRRWSREEIKLITVVANRCWESVERARAVRRLSETEERYRAFIEQSSEAIWRFELEKPIPVALSEDEQIEMLYRYAYLAECNDAMARMYGYDRADQILGARIGDLLVRSDPRNIAHLRTFKRAGFSLTDSESHEVDREGNTKYFLNNLTGIVENGAIVRAWGTQRDITEQKRAEAALRESEERLRRITEATQDALWELNLKTRRLWWSEGAKPLFGHSPGELEIGLENWYDSIHPEDVDRVHAQFEKFLRGGAPYWFDEYRFRRADGSYVYILDQGRKSYDESGAPTLVAGAMSDITERKQAEEALRESEERYRLLTELSPDGVVIASLDGTIHLVNPSMLRMLGAAPEHVTGRNLFDFISPEYQEHCRNCMAALMTSDLPEGRVEAAFRSEDGRSLPAEVSAVRFEWRGEPYAQIVIHNITGRKQAEAERERLRAEIEAERNRLRQILEQMPIGVAIVEAPSGRPLFHNREAERLWNHSLLLSDDYQGYTQYGALHEDGSPYGPEEYPIARSLISGAVIKGDEMKYRRGDGTETFFSVDSAPIHDPEGRMVLAVTTFIDIAERKRAEQELRESEERFSKAFRASPDALIITRLSDGVILEVNDSFVSLTGYDRDEMIGKSTIELGLYGDPADRQRLLAILEEQKRVRDVELKMRRRSGEARLVSFSAEPFELRGERCWLTIGRDITESKRAQEALRESEERARRQLAQIEAIYATAPVGLCYLDTDLRFISANDQLAEIDGVSVEGHLGRRIAEVLPEVNEHVEPVARRVIETGEPALDVEKTTETPAQPGVARHFLDSFYPIKDAGGRVLGINVVVVEITQRKKIEEELERILRQEKVARAEAEVASRMKDEFLATISHELRTPLTSILGWARMLTSGSLSEPQTRHAQEVIAQSAKSQARLIDDILDTSRIITGRLKLDASLVEIERAFQAAVDVVRPSAEAKGIALSAVIEVPGGVVIGDASRLQQALWNMLSNAVKFTSEGGRIEARLGRAGDQVEITVSDTGIGIEPQFLPHIFERFRQADSASTREYGGLGLGLAIVRHIVEMHGGGVSALSAGKGQGATFKIRLPLASTSSSPELAELAESAQPESRQASAEVKGTKERRAPEDLRRLGGVRVLLVEDNPETLDMLKFVFEDCGAEVIAAASAAEALEALERFRPDALVSDIAMPDQDGYDLIREVRSRGPERGGKIPAVAVTAYARAEDRVRALASGFQMHVSKPVAPDELIAVVASLTGHIHF